MELTLNLSCVASTLLVKHRRTIVVKPYVDARENLASTLKIEGNFNKLRFNLTNIPIK